MIFLLTPASIPLLQVRKWRRQLHEWDARPSAGEQPVFTSGPANAWAPAASCVDADSDGRESHGGAQAADADANGGDQAVSPPSCPRHHPRHLL